jgi:hypothetical protein
MAYIPKDAQWYLADMVIEHRIANEPQNIIHINTTLIQASSPEDAYAHAQTLGREMEDTYENTDGDWVTVIFRGLHNLLFIYENLEHGAELAYSEKVGLSEADVQALLAAKSELAVFRPQTQLSSSKPNYIPKSVMDRLQEAGFDETEPFES